MNFKKFKTITDLTVIHTSRTNALYKLGIDSYRVFPELDLIFDLLWGEILTKEGKEWFEWFMYDKNYVSGKLRKDLTASDESGKAICKNLRELHKYLTENGYFRSNEPLSTQD
jgi:hypothetical protein